MLTCCTSGWEFEEAEGWSSDSTYCDDSEGASNSYVVTSVGEEDGLAWPCSCLKGGGRLRPEGMVWVACDDVGASDLPAAPSYDTLV